MADAAHTHTAQDSAVSRQIRVFLSSTFRDFMEERDLLVKQVFPSLRRRAQERSVEVVDVDLRWGVTQEESEQGKVIGICLAEIERCRPYFIGMLGERYGWTPGKTDYPNELFEREQLGWIRDHQGNASVTELEILHGVLNDKEMAGRAFFYFRDPAWSRGQSEPGFVCETAEEEAKLAALKDRIRASGFPVAEALPDPKAIADQIEADLWALIEEQYPDLDQADALEKEARKHASYRQSRLEFYLGQDYVEQLETLIHGGEQKVLITGESGSGKSALIANWMHQHERENPGDVVYAHHLGCSNDANAIRPLLGRMLDTASKLLNEAELITKPIQVPEDWWELTAKVAETLQDLGRWCCKAGKRWIWVLDGLDRLADDDQHALPWLPLLIPEGVSVVISALECPARAILLERQFQLLEIGALRKNEQEQLIETYLERYTKKLDADRVEQILACDLAKSPLFLRVLLEELRQCGRFETLESQIADYISPNDDGDLDVTELYSRVLARIESDYGYEPVRKVLTALWASRAGLAEAELVAITGLSPLEWAPIDLTLEIALSRNSNKLVFDHDFLRIAVQRRYLPAYGLEQQVHSDLADWYTDKPEWAENDARELPWQLLRAQRLSDLQAFLLKPLNLAYLEHHIGANEVFQYWLAARFDDKDRPDQVIADATEKYLSTWEADSDEKIWLINRVAAIIDATGLCGEHLHRLRAYSLRLEEGKVETDEEDIIDRMSWLACSFRELGDYSAAEPLLLRCLEGYERLLGVENQKTLVVVEELGKLLQDQGNYGQAEEYYKRALEAKKKIHGDDHPSTLVSMGNLALLLSDKGDCLQAEEYYRQTLDAQERMLGPRHHETLTTLGNLGCLLRDIGNNEQAEACLVRCLEAKERLAGSTHPSTLISAGNLGLLCKKTGDISRATDLLARAMEGFECALGPNHRYTLVAIGHMADLLRIKGDHEQAEALYKRDLDASEHLLGPEHHSTLNTLCNLAALYEAKGSNDEAEACYRRALDAQERLLGVKHPDTNGTRFCLANLLSHLERYDESIPLRREVLFVAASRDGLNPQGILNALHLLAEDLYWVDEFEESEQLYREALAGRIASLGDDDGATMASRYGLARCLSAQERYSEAIELRRAELAWCEANDDVDTKDTLVSMHSLGCDLLAAGETVEALDVLQRCLQQRHEELGASYDDTLTTMAKVLDALSELKRQHEGIALSKAAELTLSAELGEHHPKVLTQLGNQASLHEELGDLKQAEELQRLCLSRREESHGTEHPDTLSSAYNLAEVLSQQERHTEAIPLRRRELAWCRETNGDTDAGTLASINALAIDLRETGELEEAEALFRELLAARHEVLEPDDFLISRSLGGLAKTLEQAGKLEEAAATGQEALEHRLKHQGPNSWWTNRQRMDQARVLNKLGRFADALGLLDQLKKSMKYIDESDDADTELLDEAQALSADLDSSID